MDTIKRVNTRHALERRMPYWALHKAALTPEYLQFGAALCTSRIMQSCRTDHDFNEKCDFRIKDTFLIESGCCVSTKLLYGSINISADFARQRYL